ncbi:MULTISPECIES: ester cyclase [Niastella]|uniref:Ester cyclase n=1 Tax=Niastella soli TaxID=2821487 RepID=A0ABS3YN97_9BACT|nr:ester cyclase [Niastella soli]MBO9199365.1 ester cyclase [Niastella soli]
MRSLHPKVYLLSVLLVPGIINAQAISNIKNNKKEIVMNTTQQNKEVVRQLFEEGLNKRNYELAKVLVSDEFTGLQGKKGGAAFIDPVLPLIKSFPDIQWHIVELIAEGDKVVLRWKWQGTQRAPFLALPASGKAITNEGQGVLELKNGKVINAQVLTDRLGFLQSLEVLPTDVNVLYNKKAHNGQVNFIDKFVVPAAAIKEFKERVAINRSFIEKLPGFIEDAAYEYTDNEGNLMYVTVALWQSSEALNNAKEAVQAEYKKQGFDAPAMFKRLNITMDRGIYTQQQN